MSTPSHDCVDTLLLAGAALVTGGLVVVAPCEVAVTAAAVLALAGSARRVRVTGMVVVLAALGMGALRAHIAVSRHEARRVEADSIIAQPARCSGRGRVESSPVRVRGVPRWDARLQAVVCDGQSVPWVGPATLYGGPEGLARGDEVDVIATIAAPQRLWNESGGDPRPSEAHRAVVRTGGTIDVRVVRRALGLLAWIDRARARVRDRIDATFPEDVAPMARALVLGESDLTAEDDRSFRASGLSHLLAVSGMHLVLVLALAVSALEAALARVEPIAARMDVGRVAAAVGLPVAWLYAEFAGAGGSTLRAAWMATAALAARALGRRTDTTRAFGISLAAMGVADALVAYDLSFVLSAAATAGLLAFARQPAVKLPRLAVAGVRAIITTAAASVPCVPIIARFSPTFPLGGAVANVLAVPLGESAALPLCLTHALLVWWPAAERGCAIVASGALIAVRVVARVFSVPALTVDVPPPTSWQLSAAAVALAAVILGGRRRWPLVALAGAVLALLEIGARRDGAPRGVLRATFLDVGQGDAAIVDLPDGEAIVVDGGGLVGSPIDVGARVLGPELRTRRRLAIAAAVLTHPHPDHFAGFVTGLGAVAVRELWDTGQGEAEQLGGGYAQLLRAARARGVPVLGPDRLCGGRTLGGARIDVLAPCPGFSSDRGPNDNSFVLRIGYGRRHLLLVGDAEREEEKSLLADVRGRLYADVLKVGHHGSRTSSSEAFLAAVAPREAVVSVGRRNRFGHPHAAALDALGAAGARVWRTDRDGAVVVTTDGISLDIRALGAEVMEN
jgi:competence protein ComEC